MTVQDILDTDPCVSCQDERTLKVLNVALLKILAESESGGVITGSGTALKLPVWSAGTALTDSIFSQDAVPTGTLGTIDGNIRIGATGNPTPTINLGGDAFMTRGGANIFAVRNALNACGFYVSNTYVDDSNYSRLKMQWLANAMNFGTDNLGSGVACPINFQTAGVTRMILSAAGQLTVEGLNVGRGGGFQSTNVAFGNNAQNATNTGGSNVAIGYQVLQLCTSGAGNTGVGRSVMSALTSGSSNTGVGRGALQAATTTSNSTAVGRDCLAALTTGAAGTAYGAYALKALISGSNNVAVGYQAMQAQVNGSSNTVVGHNAMFESAGVGGLITAIVDAGGGVVNATCPAHGQTGTPQITVGGTTSYNGTKTATVVDANTMSWVQAFVANETGSWVLTSSTGSNNVAIGFEAGRGITTGSGNTVIGAAMSGLTAALTNNIILGSGLAARATFDGADWTLTGRLFTGGNTIRVPTARTIATATTAGVQGDICWDANFLYVAVGLNSWKRAAISTW